MSVRAPAAPVVGGRPELSCAYVGTIVHKRLRPRRHAFTYNVFSLCLDVDEIDALSGRLRLFSRNRWNLLSFRDTDHGARDGTPIADHVRGVLGRAGLAAAGARIALLCYPRLLGYVFNPLSVYFCWRADGRLGAILYEVTNTFHERRLYVLAVDEVAVGGGTVVAQRCAKGLYVSPFTGSDGTYVFHVRPPSMSQPDQDVVVGVALRAAAGGMLKTHFRGTHRPLTDRSILALLAGHPAMTLKVTLAIHIEAARLWLKGVPVIRRTVAPVYVEDFAAATPTQHTPAAGRPDAGRQAVINRQGAPHDA